VGARLAQHHRWVRSGACGAGTLAHAHTFEAMAL